MKCEKNAYLNNQDILHWYKTPEEMEFTEQGYPILEPCSISISRRGLKLVPFNYALNYKGNKSEVYIHFYIQDYLFNRIWNDPLRYIKVLKQYKGIVMPDFSSYEDMPTPLKDFNYYRSLWFARMCQLNNIVVIPNIYMMHNKDYVFHFDGVPKNSTVFVSAKGCCREKGIIDKFYKGWEAMVEQITPSQIIIGCTLNSFNTQLKNLVIPENCKIYQTVI